MLLTYVAFAIASFLGIKKNTESPLNDFILAPSNVSMTLRSSVADLIISLGGWLFGSTRIDVPLKKTLLLSKKVLSSEWAVEGNTSSSSSIFARFFYRVFLPTY